MVGVWLIDMVIFIVCRFVVCTVVCNMLSVTYNICLRFYFLVSTPGMIALFIARTMCVVMYVQQLSCA
jgi:hypothetical protein